MLSLALWLLGGAALSFPVGYFVWSQRAWRQTGAETDLEFSSTLLHGYRLSGARRGFEVEVGSSSENRRSQVVLSVHGVFPGFTLARASPLDRLGAPDVQTGDPRLDRRTHIAGDSDLVLAVLGPKARELVETLVVDADGRVAGETLWVPLRKIRRVPAILDSVLDLAELLRRPSPDEIPRRLAERVLDDPSAGVRLEAFRRLEASFPGSELLRTTATRLLGSPDVELRLEACRRLLREPEPNDRVVQAVVKIARREHLDPTLRTRALEALARPRFRDDAAPAMAAVLNSAIVPSEVRRTALDGLVRLGAREALLRVEVPDNPAEAKQLARGLGTLDVAAQPSLLELLDHPDDGVRETAARALGRVGDVRAVARLRRLAESAQLFRSAPARAAEAAIVEIQSRAGGSQAGEISLASVEPLQGAVSPPEEPEGVEDVEGGEVSLTS